MASHSRRLPEPAGLLIDRSTPVSFSFEGNRYSGFAGDTIASALVANGVATLSRSFKYHRRRGVLSMCGHDANSLVQIGPRPNALADKILITDGMAARGQNYFGSLENDRAALLGLLGRFMPAGFYYKAFHTPKILWPFWEKVIRRIAGLGEVDLSHHHEYYDKEYLFADVGVVGGGPAGMAAALKAAESGAEVVLVDDMDALGGSLNYARFDAKGEAGAKARAKLVAQVEAQSNIRVMTRTMCNGWFFDNWLPLVGDRRLYKLRAKALVAATGTIDQHVVFHNNDLPGVMMASGAQRLIRLYGVRPGTRAVVVTTNGDGYGAALDLLDAGVDVACVVDLRAEPAPDERYEAVLHKAHIPIFANSAVREAIPSSGNKGVRAVDVARVVGDGQLAAQSDRFECDLVAVAGGYNPFAALVYQAGGQLSYDEDAAMFGIAGLPEHLFAAGSVDGAFHLDAVNESGRIAGWAAAKDAGFNAGRKPASRAEKGTGEQNFAWPMFPHPKAKEFIDFDEDLQVKDIVNTIAEGFDHIELQKRFSTVGMGPSQGRHSLLPSVRINARANGRSVDETGVTTQRSPISQITISHLAGRIFDPVRVTPMHRRHLELGARMMTAGVWMRPEYYGTPDSRADSILREVKSVRENVGVIDVSTLGSLVIQGPDAAEFLERVYTFAYKKQALGRARYVLMTDQSGVITDDGVACRLHNDHFYVTATTSGADAVYRTMLWFNTQWRLKVNVINATASYAAVNLGGPNARKVMEKIDTDIDFSSEAFPYMGVREGRLGDIPATIMRIGFVGELGYEIHVPSAQGEALWDALFEAGAEFGIMPFGIEAQRLLRLEKGHIIISQDTDGLTTPHEADMVWALARKKPFFVGERSIGIQAARGLERKLIGFELVDSQGTVPLEAHLTLRGNEITGRLTSVGRSPTLGKVIGLGYVAPDQAEIGTEFDIKAAHGEIVKGRVAKLPFYDPDGERQEM